MLTRARLAQAERESVASNEKLARLKQETQDAEAQAQRAQADLIRAKREASRASGPSARPPANDDPDANASLFQVNRLLRQYFSIAEKRA